MAGARTKLSQEKLELIKTLLEEGHFATTVQRAINVSDRGWYNWKDKGEEIEQLIDEEQLTENELTEYEALCYQFVQIVKEAEAIAEMKALNEITSAARKNWQAAAWYLERKHRERWGRDGGDNAQGGQTALDKFLNAMTRQVEDTLEEEEEE